MATKSPQRDVAPEELAALPEFYHPTISPDGGTVAFYYDVTGRNELFLLDRTSGELEQLSDGNVPRNARWHLQWGGAGDRVYFHWDDSGDEQNDLYAADRDGNVEPVVEVNGQVVLADTASDGESLLYTSDVGEQMNVYRYDVATGEHHQLTEYDQPVFTARYGPNDERVAYLANESSTLENRDAYVMNADGSEKRRLEFGTDGSEAGLAGWFPDGERLLVSDNSNDLRRVGIYDLPTDTVEWLGDHSAEESAIAVSPDGQRVFATRKRRGATVPVIYDTETGAGRELDVPEGVASVGTRDATTPFADASTLVFGYSTASDRQELYEYDLESDQTDVLLEADYGDIDPEIFVGADYVTYESTDGTEIGALLFDARDGPARRRDEQAPAVVMVHGGPHARSSKRFNIYVQFLVTQGYTVLQPNYRGSTGRGRSFKQAILNDWGGMEQADVAEGGRWLQNQKGVDDERVAVFGGSYGGYSVYSQLTQYPELWTTGVAWIGITDLHALFENSMSHFQHMLRMQMGAPEENHDLWRDRSPIEHVENVQRPLFMLHGVNDPRCPVEQARMFRDGLQERGWEDGEDFEYEELGEEGHGSTDISQQTRVFNLLTDYLDRRL